MPPAWGSAIIGADVAAAIQGDGVDDNARRRAVVVEANASRLGSVIVSADTATDVRRDGLDNGAGRRTVVAEADATCVGQRHRWYGRGCCRPPRRRG